MYLLLTKPLRVQGDILLFVRSTYFKTLWSQGQEPSKLKRVSYQCIFRYKRNNHKRANTNESWTAKTLRQEKHSGTKAPVSMLRSSAAAGGSVRVGSWWLWWTPHSKTPLRRVEELKSKDSMTGLAAMELPKTCFSATSIAIIQIWSSKNCHKHQEVFLDLSIPSLTTLTIPGAAPAKRRSPHASCCLLSSLPTRWLRSLVQSSLCWAGGFSGATKTDNSEDGGEQGKWDFLLQDSHRKLTCFGWFQPVSSSFLGKDQYSTTQMLKVHQFDHSQRKQFK